MSDARRGERYSILSELGRGGMGVVYAAFDNLRVEQVALKRLSLDRFSSPQEKARATALFEHEFYTLSQLAHPHVISVFDYGVDGEGPYYTMESLRGDSLRARAPLPWREAARVVRDVASALAIVHSRRLVHRDVTPQNIHCGSESGAKLLDFGAMIPMGIAKQLVGTPAFIAPECLESQPLDGQTDLFALGASLYYAVSGRHAYPARSLEQLATTWREPPVPLSQLAPDIPAALDALVASLISLSPPARPRTAAEVYERLTSIADLPRSESAQVGRAYLTRPALVGRMRELDYLRRRSKRAVSAEGSAVILSGPAGIGRTRLLDAAVLEARLAGFRIARADASDSQGRPLGAIERILTNLRDSGASVTPELTRHGLDSLLAGASETLLSPERRERSVRDLAQVIIDLSHQRPVAIAVDDVQTLDDPSLAVLASLATEARRHSLWIVATLDSAAATRSSAALRLLAKSSRQLALRPLSFEACRALLSSVFGEVPNLDVFSALCHRRCLGNARHLMECAQAAVDAGLARYAGGAWALTNDANAIAATLDRLADIEQQIATLSPDAVDLLEALAFDRETVLDLTDYPALTEHGDSARMHRALSELQDTGWLVLNGDRARFQRDDQLARVAARVTPTRVHAIHARIAECCAKPELAPVYQAYHWVKAGELERALLPMEEMTRFVEANPNTDAVRSPITLQTLQLFSEMPDVPGAHPGARANYVATLIVNAIYRGSAELGASHIDRALREIAPYTGVSDYRELHELPDAERLQLALTRANERCQLPGIGGLDLVRFIRRQTQLCVTSSVCASFMDDTSLLEGLPDLTPFVALSPALAIAQRLIDGLCKLARGQTWLAWDAFDAVCDLAFSPHAEAIDGLTLVALRVTGLGYLSTIEAEHASPKTLDHLARYAQLMPYNAQSLRARYYFANGELANWSRARQQSELLSVQTHSSLETRHSETAAYLGSFSLAEDLLGLRRVHAEIVELTNTRPGWRYREAIARCHILRCQNRCTEALAIAESSLSDVPVLHSDFIAATVTYLELLLATEHREMALRAGEAYLERARTADMPAFRIELVIAHAHAELGEHAAAERHYGEAMRALEARGVRGLLLGRAFETGARVALNRGDATTFAERAKHCANHYAVQQNPTLATRVGQLTRDAARAGVIAASPTPRDATSTGTDSGLKALAAHTEDSQFYAGALEFLVKRSGSVGGYLYVPTPDGLQCVARTEGLHWTDSVTADSAARACYERAGCSASEEPDSTTQSAPVSGPTPHGDAMMLFPCVLARTTRANRALEAVVLLVAASPMHVSIPSGSLEDLALLLMQRSQSLKLDTDTVSTTR